MCCRFMLLSDQVRDLLARAGVPDEEGDVVYPENNYNIAPGSRLFGVGRGNGRVRRGEDAAPGNAMGQGVACARLSWGLAQARAGSVNPLFNARAEGLWERPFFREAARARRCLIPASGFYEWARLGRERLPWFFQLRDEQAFFLAGIWEPLEGADGVQGCCAVITTEPNDLMRSVHHRMPAILSADDAATWLGASAVRVLRDLLRPFPPEHMRARRLSSRINSVRNNDAACLDVFVGGAADSGSAGQQQVWEF